jgi:DnaD/phage-associated family protein
MKKDAFYFPHFCNARHDRKIKRLVKELGVEGYGMFFMTLEVLREQLDFKYPLEDIDLLADEFKTSEQKLRTVICNYKLFEVDLEGDFFSPKQIEYLQPYIKAKEQRRLAGIESGKKRSLSAKTPYEEKFDLPQVYIIECYNNNEKFIKIGATKGSISRRFSGHLPYKYKVIRQFFLDDYYTLESEFQLKFKNFCYNPGIKFSGDAECYNISIKQSLLNYIPETNFSHEHRCNENSFSFDEDEQSKVKKSKGKESKVKEIKEKEKSVVGQSVNIDKSINFYNKNIGGITPYVAEEMDSFIEDGIEEDLIIKAMQKAVDYGKASWGYAKGILNNCYKENIKTVEQFDAKEMQRNNQGKKVENNCKENNGYTVEDYERIFSKK